MVNKCDVFNCKGNYYKDKKCRVFRLPRDHNERQKWINVLPPRERFVIDADKFFICEKHWSNPHMIKIAGGSTRPAIPPSIFDVPKSCLPTPKPSPRPAKDENRLSKLFHSKDCIPSFDSFDPTKHLEQKYSNLICSRSSDRFTCLFMSEDFHECLISVVVDNKKTLCSPLTFSASRDGIKVPVPILNPNNGLASYSQFFEAVHFVVNFEHPLEEVVKKAVVDLKCAADCSSGNEKVKKVEFLTHQLQLLAQKQFTTSDVCFAIECYPKCSYEQLRDYLVLPSPRKLRDIISSVDKSALLTKTFESVIPQQKNVFLLVDEVKVRPTVAFAGGVLSGMAENEKDYQATSMLCVMMRSLHRGPSVMLSVTPVHKLTASFQFEKVKEAAAAVEKAGGHVLRSITDNHKVNQQYCKLFSCDGECTATARHPLDNGRVWFLLYDTVHLLKCVRNNWITEKTQSISLCGQSEAPVASFSHVKDLYAAEKNSILKMTPLTQASVTPSKLQLQNVHHVLNVFNERVVGALKTKGHLDTASFVETMVNWWNTVNVSKQGMDRRFKDPYRAVQRQDSTNLDTFLNIFEGAESGHGANRIRCLTHDTKRALVQTMQGLKAVCTYLLTSAGFEYVVLRELQSDRLEGEFAVYRQSTGASIEKIISGVTLSVNEESSAAYVAGWLESQSDLKFPDEEPVVDDEVGEFIRNVSRGSLKIPHECTYQLVRIGLSFVKQARIRACCRKRLSNILNVMAGYMDILIHFPITYNRLSNVLLNGLQNLEKDHQKNAVLLQTSVKKARLAD